MSSARARDEAHLRDWNPRNHEYSQYSITHTMGPMGYALFMVSKEVTTVTMWSDICWNMMWTGLKSSVTAYAGPCIATAVRALFAEFPHPPAWRPSEWPMPLRVHAIEHSW
jgi:hypothetical protein